MNINFLNFVKHNKIKNSIDESFKKWDIDIVTNTILKILKKHISKIICLPGGNNIKINSKTFYAITFIVNNANSSFTLNWDKESKEIVSISFFDKYQTVNLLYDGKASSNLTIDTLGSSIIYFLPIIWTLVNSENYDITKEEAIRLGRSLQKNESFDYYVGKLKYTVIYEATKIDPELDKYKDKKRSDAINSYIKDKSYKGKQESDLAWDDYKEIMNAINNGVTTLEELKLALKHNSRITLELDVESAKCEADLKSNRESPEKVFKKMEKYIELIIKGINPSLIICGAPGVGKTFRVTSQLKENGYVEGKNMHTIKGKCTARTLYTTLYDFQDKGEIIVIDDADGLVGPKAPEECINILKGALDSSDSTEGRLVTYGISGKLVDDEGKNIPKRFYYKGSIIVITNYNAGSLDTALKGRSYIQDINFTNEEVLDIIKSLMSKIDPEHLSDKSKSKALKYLIELNESKTEMEISIRTFIICAKIFEVCGDDDDFSAEDAKSMIKEQMKLQSDRRKAKY